MTDRDKLPDGDRGQTPPQIHDHSTSLVEMALEFARKPVNSHSLVGTITVSGFIGITMAHTDIAAGAIFGLGAVALLVIRRWE